MIAGPLTVVKVGGSLLGSAAEVERVGQAVARRRSHGARVLVVASALKGVTDLLECAAGDALDPRSGGELVRDVMERLRDQHREAMAGLPDRDALWLRIRPALDGVERLLTGIRLTGELTDRTHDVVLAHGERLSAPIVAAAVLAGGADARAVLSEEAGLRATRAGRVGRCDPAACREDLLGLQHELHDRVLVLTGFYGIDDGGEIVLFGRGGSDYTAGVVAAGIGASAVELWKNVPGFMSADPHAVTDARLVPELSYDEACELGYYGSRILHPRCLEPLRDLPVEVSVRSIEDPDALGTALVTERHDDAGRVAALAVRDGVAVIQVEGAAMVNEPGVVGTILGTLGKAGINVDAIASAMTSVSFTVDDGDVPLARKALRLLVESGATGVASVDVRREAALLGVVGDGVASDASIAARMLQCLSEHQIPVHLISHGPGDVSVNCVIPHADLDEALASLHRTFFGATLVDAPEAEPSRKGSDRP